MDLMELMMSSGSGGALQQLARQFGIDEGQAQSAVARMMPALSQGLKRDMADPGNASKLLRALQQGDHQRYLDQPETLAAPETVADGNAILGHLFGSKEVSRRVAEQASGDTGLDQGMLKQMLPVVATMLMGSLSKQSAASGDNSGEGLMGMVSGFLDADGDGSVVDDLMGMAGKFFR